MSPATRNQIDPTMFWDDEDGSFKAYSCAERLADTYSLATTVDSDKIYWHNGRTWHEYGDQTLRSEIRALLRDASSYERVNEVVRNVKHITRQSREDIFDLPPEKLVVRNGVVDLITGEFESERGLPPGEPGTLTCLDVEYDPDAIPERFNDFLFEVLDRDDVSIMWELIGYCLYRGYPFQKAALFLGDGANGKSTLLDALREFLGEENIAGVELQDFSNDQFAAADLEGKLANMAADLNRDELERTGMFKALTGGDLIRAQRKYEDSFHFENQATLMFSANNPPAADDDTFAYRRRWLYFEFPNTFSGEDAVPQADLLEQFRDEQSGILNLAIDRFQELWARGGFEETVYHRKHGDDATDTASNPAYPFSKNRIEQSEGDHLRMKRAGEAFREWCDENGKPTQGRSALKRAVEKLYSPSTGKDPGDGRYKVWNDLRLKGDDGPDGKGGNDGTQARLPGDV